MSPLRAALIDADGMPPHVQPGDHVVVDTFAPVDPGSLALLVYGGLTLVGWYIVDETGVYYQLADRSTLAPADVELLGPVVSIARTPPVLLS